MRILRVISTLNPQKGGPAQGIRNLTPSLAKYSIYTDVICLDDPSEKFLKEQSFKIHALGKARNAWSYHPGLIPWLLKNISSYDVVIIHGLWLFPSYAVAKVLKTLRNSETKKIPLSYIYPHGMLDPWFQRDPSRKLKAFRNWIYWNVIEKKVVHTVDSILFTCHEELLNARKTFKKYNPKAENDIGYGLISPPAYSESHKTAYAKINTFSDDSYILFLSRINPKKGVDLLIKAYAHILTQQKEISHLLPNLLIAGPLDSPYATEMQDLAEKLPLSLNGLKRVQFCGMLQGDAKWGAFYGCEAFILPSHQENFGIAVVEALSCGKPALISKQVNIWNEIIDSEAGLAMDDNLEDTIALLMEWIATPTSIKIKMATNARKCFESKFNVEQAAKKLKLFLDEQLALIV